MNDEISTVPKIIHYVWVGGAEKPLEYVKYIESWKKHLPDYEIIEWNEKNFDVNCCDFIKEAYENRQFAFVADYIRLVVLYEYGGIYLDIDVEVLKSYDDLLSYNSVLCFENAAYLTMGTILAKPKQEWIKELIEYYKCSHFKVDGKFDAVPNTIKTSIFLHKRYGLELKEGRQSLKDGIEIFPADYFAPQDYTTGKTNITENTYSVHEFKVVVSGGKGFLYKFLRAIRYIFGKKIFGWFARMYIKSQVKKLGKEF